MMTYLATLLLNIGLAAGWTEGRLRPPSTFLTT